MAQRGTAHGAMLFTRRLSEATFANLGFAISRRGRLTVGADGVAGVDFGVAVPIAEASAGFFDDGLDGGGVPNV